MPESRREQEEGGELDSQEEASPEEVKSRELDFFCFSCFPTAELHRLNILLFWRRSTAALVFRVGACFEVSPIAARPRP